MRARLGLWSLVMMAWPACAQILWSPTGLKPPEPTVKPLPGLSVRMSLPRTTCELGTAIDATLTFSYTGTTPVWVGKPLEILSLSTRSLNFVAIDSANRQVNNRSAYIDDRLMALPVEPLVAGKPVERQACVTIGLQFERAGSYRLTCETSLVRLEDGPNSPLASAQSNTVLLTITEPDEGGRQRRMAAARAALANGTADAQRSAAFDLRMMRDSRTYDLLFDYFDCDEPLARGQATLALEEARDGRLLRDPLERYLAAPDRFVSYTAYSSLGTIAGRVAAAGQTEPSLVLRAATAGRQAMMTRLSQRLIDSLASLPPGKAAAEVGGCLQRGYLPTDVIGYWKVVLNGADQLSESHSEADQAVYFKLDQPKLGDDLTRVAGNAKVPVGMRAAALRARQRMNLGNEASLPMLAADAMLPVPVFAPVTLALLGDYQAAPIAEALRPLLRSDDPAIRASAAERVYRLAAKVPNDEIIAALTAVGQPADRVAESTLRYLLLALSERDMAAAWPTMAKVLDAPDWASVMTVRAAWTSTAASKLPAARQRTAAVFASASAAQQAPLLRSMAAAVSDADQLPSAELRSVLAWWTPELIEVFSAGRSSELRSLSQQMLTTITGVKPESPREPVDVLAARFEEWLDQHKADIGR